MEYIMANINKPIEKSRFAIMSMVAETPNKATLKFAHNEHRFTLEKAAENSWNVVVESTNTEILEKYVEDINNLELIYLLDNYL